jgi:hypothetical protein
LARRTCAWTRCGEAHPPRDVFKALAFIARFERVNRPLIEAELAQWAPDVRQIRLTTREQVGVFLASFTPSAAPPTHEDLWRTLASRDPVTSEASIAELVRNGREDR